MATFEHDSMLPSALSSNFHFFTDMRAKNSTEFFAHEVIRNVRHVFTMTSAAFSVPAVVIVAMCMNRSSRSYSINIILIIVSFYARLIENKLL